MSPRRLGQHFLIRGSVLERLAAAVCPDPQPLVIEIGPGRGALTRYLLGRAERVVAIEIDATLVRHLREKFAGEPRLEVIEADVLETDLGQWGPASLAGNLPYYISSPILKRIFAASGTLVRAVLLVQKEVAERIAAAPGSRAWGYLTVAAKLYAEPELLFTVPAAAFCPPPKVDSAAVRLTMRPPREAWSIEDRAGFLEFAGQSFRYKRKTLRNNLAPIYGKEAVDHLPEAGLRAEQVPMARLVELYRLLKGKAG